jgi:L-ascorbate metabolism protein UlaG (beta-lactamase superfamily)
MRLGKMPARDHQYLQIMAIFQVLKTMALLSAAMKKAIVLFIFLSAAVFVTGQQGRMIDQVKGQKTGLKVWWAGQDSWIIRSGDLVIATDLFLEDSGRIAPSPVTPEELAGILDISFITHSHGDHFEEFTTRILVRESKCMFVMPESCLEEARRMNIPGDRIVVARPRQPFDIMGIKVEPLRAIHGNANFAIYYDANLQDCGYLLTMGGKTILQPGDTYLLEDHLLIKKKVNVLMFSPTEHNMYIDPSLILINRLDADYVFPQHHSTVLVNEENRFWAKGYPDEVKLRLDSLHRERYHILRPGEGMKIN